MQRKLERIRTWKKIRGQKNRQKNKDHDQNSRCVDLFCTPQIKKKISSVLLCCGVSLQTLGEALRIELSGLLLQQHLPTSFHTSI